MNKLNTLIIATFHSLLAIIVRKSMTQLELSKPRR